MDENNIYLEQLSRDYTMKMFEDPLKPMRKYIKFFVGLMIIACMGAIIYIIIIDGSLFVALLFVISMIMGIDCFPRQSL